jgi:hypothetical protein
VRRQELLRQLIKAEANGLKAKKDINKESLLTALLYSETKMGKKMDSKPEPAFMPGGQYFTKENVQEAFGKYGELAAFSYGPWQLPYIVARDLGFEGSPEELAEPKTNLHFTIQYLNQRILKGAKTVSQIADCYSKNYIDRRVPHSYVRRFIQAYNGKAVEWLNGKDI